MSERKFTETHGDFTIRYDVWDEGGAIDADVYETADPSKLVFTLLTKWDGCSHLRMPYLHFDGIEAFEKVAAVVSFIYNELADRHGVGEDAGAVPA